MRNKRLEEKAAGDTKEETTGQRGFTHRREGAKKEATMFTILAGPARSGKTERLLTRYRAALGPEKGDSPHLPERPEGCFAQMGTVPFFRPGAALWLSPTWRAAAEVRERLLSEPVPVFCGCFCPAVMTFEKFAESVLQASGAAIRPMTRLMKRELVRQLIGEQAARGRLKYFQPIAATGGLVDLVCEFISELKRLEIWPQDFLRACTARGIADKDQELLEIYDGYQQALREHRLYDAEGRFWSARDLLQRGEGERGKGKEENDECGMMNDELVGAKRATAHASVIHHSSFIIHHLQLAIADGFTDFTRTQHEILQILASRAEEMIVTLPLEAEPRRANLFAKPLKTLAELRRRHPGLVVEELARAAPPQWPAMAHLEQMLFANPRVQGSEFRVQGSELENDVPSSAEPRTLNPDPSFSDIEILGAARQEGEIELIGARIKRLLVDGLARPGEVAVVFRSPQDAGGLIDEVFGRLGIPVVAESGRTLDHSPALRALAGLLQLDLDDWPFGELLAVIQSNYFQPDWPEWQDGRAAVAIERTLRRLQIPHGRQRVLEQVVLLQRLARMLDELPEKATLAGWAKAWQRLAGQTGLRQAMEQRRVRETHHEMDEADDGAFHAPYEDSNTDYRAWNRLMEALAAGDKLSKWLGQRPPELDRRQAFDTLVDILRSEQIGHAGDESGYVRVLSAASVRSLRIPYLFLSGLSEKAFPPPDREDRLYSEAEYLRLIDEGLPLIARTERNREEMLLFYEAITRATRRLYLSYPALDSAAQPLSPSPFLNEVEQACDGRIPRTERADLSPIPQDDEPLCEAEFRVKAVAMALEGNVALLAGLMRVESAKPQAANPKSLSPLPSPLSSNLIAGMELTHLRQDRDHFGPAEGVLQSTAVRNDLSARFPPTHTFSATELEQYASCPFRYFLERILKVEPLEDLTLEFDVLERGRLAHDVLAAFHQRVNEQLGRPSSPLKLDAAEFDRLLASAIDESLPPAPSNPVQAALREVNRRQVTQWLAQYRTQCEKYDKQWQGFESPMAAELFEVSFGRGDGKSPSSDRPLELTAENQTVRIAGRIDRIDCGTEAGHAVFNVLDYKTGGSVRSTPEAVAAGTALQLPLYALAAMELLLTDRDAVPWQAGYWYLRDDGFKPRQALRMYRNDDGRIELEPAWEQMRAGLADTVVGLVGGIRRGQFPVCSRDDRCTGYCPFSTVCRINQVRSLEKICQPTAELV